jgi:hypothetical protein
MSDGVEGGLALGGLAVVVEPLGPPARDLGGGDGAVVVDVGDVVRVLVPQAPGPHPAIVLVAVDEDAVARLGRRVRADVGVLVGEIVGANDDLGVVVTVHVDHHRVLVDRRRRVRDLQQHGAVGPRIDAHVALVVVDHLGLPIALEVEHRRARAVGRLPSWVVLLQSTEMVLVAAS